MRFIVLPHCTCAPCVRVRTEKQNYDVDNNNNNIVTEHAKRAQLTFKIILSFSCQTPTSVNFRQNVFSCDSVSATIHLPSREVLEPITGSFIPSAQLRDGSLFLDSALSSI